MDLWEKFGMSEGIAELWQELGISAGTAIVVLAALYFVIKWAVKNGMKCFKQIKSEERILPYENLMESIKSLPSRNYVSSGK